MKTEELMVGDYIFREGYGIAKVFEVRTTSVLVQLVSDGQIITWSKLIEPIPLTAEILEKNGFEHPRTRMLLENRDYHIRIYRRSNNIWGFYHENDNGGGCYWTVAQFTFVHELQHALRICGIKKEIVL